MREEGNEQRSSACDLRAGTRRPARTSGVRDDEDAWLWGERRRLRNDHEEGGGGLSGERGAARRGRQGQGPRGWYARRSQYAGLETRLDGRRGHRLAEGTA